MLIMSPIISYDLEWVYAMFLSWSWVVTYFKFSYVFQTSFYCIITKIIVSYHSYANLILRKELLQERLLTVKPDSSNHLKNVSVLDRMLFHA